jgi:SNF family Na+-dependent transporter
MKKDLVKFAFSIFKFNCILKQHFMTFQPTVFLPAISTDRGSHFRNELLTNRDIPVLVQQGSHDSMSFLLSRRHHEIFFRIPVKHISFFFFLKLFIALSSYITLIHYASMIYNRDLKNKKQKKTQLVRSVPVSTAASG